MNLKEEVVELEGTSKTPKIILHKANGYLLFQGRSIPENTFEFYTPINNWLDSYCMNPMPLTQMDIRLEYFNTSSSKCLLDLFKKLESLKKSDFDVKVNWFFEREDDDMKEAGEDYKAIVSIPFEIVEVDEL